MSDTYPLQASALRIGGHVMMEDHPCKIIKMTTSKTGKHGHAKCHITGTDIFAGTKHDMLIGSTHNVDVPNVSRGEYHLMDIDEEDYLSLIDDKHIQRDDLKLPPNNELAEKLRDAFDASFDTGAEISVVVLKAVGIEQVISFK
jgi:translation initiation factor 5A